MALTSIMSVLLNFSSSSVYAFMAIMPFVPGQYCFELKMFDLFLVCVAYLFIFLCCDFVCCLSSS
jgi:hypothetical protein